MPDWIAVILLGIVEGITEFIPVSSTGHLLLTEHLLGVHRSDLFIIVIQCGAVLAILPLFPERLKQFFFRWREPATLNYLLKIFVAFAITGAGGLLLDQLGFQLPERPLPIALALLAGGVLFLAAEWRLRGRPLQNEITWTVVVAVAAGQLIAAAFPGTSRSGATIISALLVGLNRPLATEFSFLVGIPTMLAAGGWHIVKAIQSSPSAPTEDWVLLGLGTAVAALVSFAAVKWLLRYVQTHTFVVFGWYRIVLGLVLLLLLYGQPTLET